MNPFNGRIGRVRYLFYNLTWGLMGAMALAMDKSLPSSFGALLSWLVLAAVIIPVIILLGLAVRRFHDTDKSGWYILLMFVPIANLYFALYLLLKAGNPAPNLYGEPPRSKKRDLFSFACFAVLLALLIGSSKWSSFSYEQKVASITSDSILTTIDTSNWQTYRNNELGFEFKYPANWTAKPGIQSSVVIRVTSNVKPSNSVVRYDNYVEYQDEFSVTNFTAFVKEGNRSGDFAGRPAYIWDWDEVGGSSNPSSRLDKGIRISIPPYLGIGA